MASVVRRLDELANAARDLAKWREARMDAMAENVLREVRRKERCERLKDEIMDVLRRYGADLVETSDKDARLLFDDIEELISNVLLRHPNGL